MKEYTVDDIQSLSHIDHIRLRPGMYLGNIGLKGFVELLKGFFSISLDELKTDLISFEFIDTHSGKLTISNIKNPVIDNWSRHRSNTKNPFILEYLVLNALSKTFQIKLSDKATKTVYEQNYERGIFINGDTDKNEIYCSQLEIAFALDETIWTNDFVWNTSFINFEIREFAYLHKEAKFKVTYPIDGEICNVIYFFKEGLKDRLNIEKLRGLGGSYFDSVLDTKIEDFDIEIAFAFRDYIVDEPFLKSFVNDYYTPENGSHVDGLLKGLTYGVMKYFQKHNLTGTYRISEKGIKENLMAMINIKMETPVFSGCVKNKLANAEIIEPIADHIASFFFKKIEADEASTKKLIEKFAI